MTSAIRASAFDWNDRVELGNGVAVTLVATRHWTARGVLDRNKALWASFVLETPAGKIYIVCDSGYGSGVHFRRAREKHGPFRAAILPIGAYEPRWFMRDQHMNPEDAVKALADCGAAQALAHHHGTFQLTNEAIDAPVKDLAVALKAANVASEKFRVLKPGEVFVASLRVSHRPSSPAPDRRPACENSARRFVSSLPISINRKLLFLFDRNIRFSFSPDGRASAHSSASRGGMRRVRRGAGPDSAPLRGGGRGEG